MSLRTDWFKLRQLRRGEWQTLAKALLLLPWYSVRIRIFGLLRCLPSRCTVDATPLIAAPEAARLVSLAARRGPWPLRCLPVSLTLQQILAEQGLGSELKLGVRIVDGRLSAHAWVEHGGAVLLDLDRAQSGFRPFDRPISATQGRDR